MKHTMLFAAGVSMLAFAAMAGLAVLTGVMRTEPGRPPPVRAFSQVLGSRP